MGAVAAGVSLVAQIGLTALGEGNVFDLVMAVVGVVTLGVGAGITKATSVAVGKGVTAGKTAIQNATKVDLGKISKIRDAAIKIGRALGRQPRCGTPTSWATRSGRTG
ncbi:hypothetical protein QP157_20910 [Sphingomonas sp. LR61]|uniref:hypothetical protein n=1 Tax=Sphingomonas sp. LR61 TaxID=3050234 RepID=UPI002FDF6DD4